MINPNVNQQDEVGTVRQEIRAVLSGTYRRGLEALTEDYDALRRAGCVVVSPTSIEFTSESNGFVLARGQEHRDPSAIELDHLEAIRTSDLVWLHAPGGYLGPSGTMEIGFAKAHAVPVFCRDQPTDQTLRPLVRVVGSPREAVAAASSEQRDAPAGALAQLQRYYSRVARQRGYSSESARDCVLLLTEELGELARAVRKVENLSRAAGYEDINPSHELADMQLYLVHLANIMDLRLDQAVIDKEKVNASRMTRRVSTGPT